MNSASSDELGQLAQQRGLRLRADDLLDDLSAGEHAERRDIHDPVSLRDHRVLVDVQLDDVDLVGVLPGDFLQNRRDLPTGTAPLGPVVHDDWLLVLQYIELEALVGHLLGCAHNAHFLSLKNSVNSLESSADLRTPGRPAIAPRPGPPRSRCPLPSPPAGRCGQRRPRRRRPRGWRYGWTAAPRAGTPR